MANILRCPRCGHDDCLHFTAPTTWRITRGCVYADDYHVNDMQTLTCDYCTLSAPAPVFDPLTVKH